MNKLASKATSFATMANASKLYEAEPTEPRALASIHCGYVCKNPLFILIASSVNAC